MHLKAMPFAIPDLFIGHTRKDHAKASSEFWFIFQDSQLLVHEDSMQPVQKMDLPFDCSLYMGVYQKLHIHAGQVPLTQAAPLGTIWKDLKLLYGHMNEELFALAGKAVQLIAWDRSHQFCGRCGHMTHEKPNERAKECPSCKLVAFPRISPAVMALIQRDDKILLARSPHFPIGRYSALAGFVEPGETLEQCVKREVFEEVGLHVNNIHYFASQSWPFPNSLMIAFTCSWESGAIKIDPSEIEDAQWFNKEALPLLPSEMSLSRILIEAALSKLGDD